MTYVSKLVLELDVAVTGLVNVACLPLIADYYKVYYALIPYNRSSYSVAPEDDNVNRLDVLFL